MSYRKKHYLYHRSSLHSTHSYNSTNHLIDDKYKNANPELFEFGLTEYDLTSVKKEYELWEEELRQKKIVAKQVDDIKTKKGCIIDTLIALPISIGCVAAIFYNDFSFGAAFVYLLLIFPGILFFTTIGHGLALRISNNRNPSKEDPVIFPLQNKLDNISLYEKALKEYEYWQNRKKEDFWRQMSGRAFEHAINDLFIRHGYKTELCHAGGDGGIDIMAKKNNEQYAIQCKAHTNKISPSIARDLLGTVSANRLDGGYLITLNGGTVGTIDFCKKNKLVLWELKDILEFQNNY